MNSVFVGGNSEGPGVTTNPWSTSVAATRMSQVGQPAQVVLFGSSIRVEGGEPVAAETGWHELRAPFLAEQQWSIGPQGAVVPVDGLDAGVPWSRSDGRTTPIVHLDGHTDSPRIEDLSIDMRRWSPFADSVNWRLAD